MKVYDDILFYNKFLRLPYGIIFFSLSTIIEDLVLHWIGPLSLHTSDVVVLFRFIFDQEQNDYKVTTNSLESLITLLIIQVYNTCIIYNYIIIIYYYIIFILIYCILIIIKYIIYNYILYYNNYFIIPLLLIIKDNGIIKESALADLKSVQS